MDLSWLVHKNVCGLRIFLFRAWAIQQLSIRKQTLNMNVYLSEFHLYFKVVPKPLNLSHLVCAKPLPPHSDSKSDDFFSLCSLMHVQLLLLGHQQLPLAEIYSNWQYWCWSEKLSAFSCEYSYFYVPDHGDPRWEKYFIGSNRSRALVDLQLQLAVSEQKLMSCMTTRQQVNMPWFLGPIARLVCPNFRSEHTHYINRAVGPNAITSWTHIWRTTASRRLSREQ